jgi:hypothetical protein
MPVQSLLQASSDLKYFTSEDTYIVRCHKIFTLFCMWEGLPKFSANCSRRRIAQSASAVSPTQTRVLSGIKKNKGSANFDELSGTQMMHNNFSMSE